MMALTATLVMIGVVVLQHLGLTVTLAQIALRIARCYKCCAFWAVLGVAFVCDYDCITAVLLAALMAYISHYIALFLALLHRFYLWLSLKVLKK
jgi:hypothetical protein